MTSIEARLVEAREYVGLSQAFVEAVAGLEPNSLTSVEQGRRQPNGDELSALAALYGCPEDHLRSGSTADFEVPLHGSLRGSSPSEEDIVELGRFAAFLETREKPSTA